MRVVSALREEPRNAQQLSLALGLDYTTVRHHLRVLQRNRLVEATGDRYGQVYFVASSLEGRWATIDALRPKGSKRRSVR